MAILKFKCAFALLLITSACTAAPPATPASGMIHIDNALDKCQHITQHTVELASIPTIKLEYQTLGSTAQCGCKSRKLLESQTKLAPNRV
jgi:hypothetical protein